MRNCHIYAQICIYTYTCVNIIHKYICDAFSFVALSESCSFPSQPNTPAPSLTQQTCHLHETADTSAVGHSRHVCCATHQTCLLCYTSDTSAVWHSRHVCCMTKQTICFVTKQACLLCDTTDMSAVGHRTHGCCVAWHRCLLSHSQHVCCATQQTCLLRGTADICAV